MQRKNESERTTTGLNDRAPKRVSASAFVLTGWKDVRHASKEMGDDRC